MNERFVRGMNKEDKEEFIKAYKAASWLLLKIKNCMEEDINKLVLASESDEQINATNYNEKQRLNIAERRAIRKLIKYLPEGGLPREDNEDGKNKDFEVK